MPFIFDPAQVALALQSFPSLAAAIRDPRNEGVESLAFAGHRVTSSALYRLLANTHYPHLVESLRAIDAAAKAGVSLKDLRAEKLSSEFGSLLAEFLTADHLISRGFIVAKAKAGNGKKPDLAVEKGSLTASIEIYSPRTWQAREDWIRDVTDVLKNADTPHELGLSVELDAGGLIHADDLEDAILRSGLSVLHEITSSISDVSPLNQGETWVYPHCVGGLVTHVRLDHVVPNASGLVRHIATSPPGHTYSAEEVFNGILTKVAAKAAHGQAAHGEGALKGLVVDAGRTGIDYELEQGRESFDEMLREFESVFDELGLDFVAFTIPRRGADGPTRGLLAPRVVFESSRVSRAELQEFFDLA